MQFFEFSTCLNPSIRRTLNAIVSDWYYYRDCLNATHGSILARIQAIANKCRATDSSEI